PSKVFYTLLNLRLGWWLSNPRYRGAWELPIPRARVAMIVAEVLGLLHDRGPFINLSDGGHFENIGIYELVRRRCRVIIVSDASEDHRSTCSSLGAAIECCRVDFGVEIEIDLSSLMSDRPDRTGCPPFFVGRINYGPNFVGTL